MHVQTPISGINSLIYRLEEAPGISEEEIKFIKMQAQKFCLASYKVRELVFCTSPAIIALASFQKGIKDAAKNPSFNFKIESVKSFLESVLPEEELLKYGKDQEERDQLWQKVDGVLARFDEFDEASKTTKKAV